MTLSVVHTEQQEDSYRQSKVKKRVEGTDSPMRLHIALVTSVIFFFVTLEKETKQGYVTVLYLWYKHAGTFF